MDPSIEAQADTPPHVEQTVQAIAKLHATHHQRATPLERLVDRLTSIVARPSFVGAIALAVVLWIAGNLLLSRLAGWRFDGPPFPWLQGAGALAALLIATLVLISQRRKDELSELREQLTLELAVLTEQKSAKLIALIEEMRRDDPALADRVDRQAEAMSTPADPQAVLDAFKETHEELMAGPSEGAGVAGGPSSSSRPASD
jgi:uncharacterized membrane protein